MMSPSGQAALDIPTAPQDWSSQAALYHRTLPLANRLIERAKQAYDLVFIDSAAIFPTNRMMLDPVALSGTADGVIMTVLAAATPRQHVRKAHKIMEAGGAKVLGVVANHGKIAPDNRA